MAGSRAHRRLAEANRRTKCQVGGYPTERIHCADPEFAADPPALINRKIEPSGSMQRQLAATGTRECHQDTGAGCEKRADRPARGLQNEACFWKQVRRRFAELRVVAEERRTDFRVQR